MPSWAWLGSSASSGNPSLAWSMGNGGKGRMLIKFPLPLDDGWYKEQPCTTFRVFQHRKERSGFKHEFIVLQLLDGSVCRIERMGDPDARFDALSPRGSVAHDMAQCFRPDELDQASLDTSDVVAEVELPCDFDLMDVLKICRAIHEGEKTRNYTLQVFNCYFFSLAIQVCLTRLVAHWEDQQLFERWLSQINTGVSALPDTFQPFADSSLRQGSILFRVYHALFPHDFDSTQNTSLVKQIKHRLQLWINEHPDSILQEIVYRVNTLLWHSTIDLGLDQFVEEKAREAVLIVVRERMSLMLDDDSEDDTSSLAIEKLKGQLILLLTQLLAIAGASANKIPKLDRISLKSKNIKKAIVHYSKPPLQATTGLGELSLKRKPVARATRDLATDWYQWITYCLSHMGLWLLHATLNMWGVTLFATRKNLITCTMIDEKLERVAYEMERLTNYGSADLERLVEELRALSESQVAVWEKNPWADICGCIAINVSINILKENETHKPVIWFCPKGKRKSMVLQSISVFQVHIQNRIEMQAREVEGVWLGSAENIQAELVDTLSQVWKLIREDTTLLKKERRRAGSRRHRGSKFEIHAWVREMQRKRKLQAGEENDDSESESSSNGSMGGLSELSRDVGTHSTEEQKDAYDEYDRRRQDAHTAAINAYVRAVEQARKLQAGEDDEEDQSWASVPTIILGSPSNSSTALTHVSDARMLNPEYKPPTRPMGPTDRTYDEDIDMEYEINSLENEPLDLDDIPPVPGAPSFDPYPNSATSPTTRHYGLPSEYVDAPRIQRYGSSASVNQPPPLAPAPDPGYNSRWAPPRPPSAGLQPPGLPDFTNFDGGLDSFRYGSNNRVPRSNPSRTSSRDSASSVSRPNVPFVPPSVITTPANSSQPSTQRTTTADPVTAKTPSSSYPSTPGFASRLGAGFSSLGFTRPGFMRTSSAQQVPPPVNAPVTDSVPPPGPPVIPSPVPNRSTAPPTAPSAPSGMVSRPEINQIKDTMGPTPQVPMAGSPLRPNVVASKSPPQQPKGFPLTRPASRFTDRNKNKTRAQVEAEYSPTHPINSDEVDERDIPSMHEPSFDPLAIRTPPHYGRPLSIISELSPIDPVPYDNALASPWHHKPAPILPEGWIPEVDDEGHMDIPPAPEIHPSLLLMNIDRQIQREREAREREERHRERQRKDRERERKEKEKELKEQERERRYSEREKNRDKDRAERRRSYTPRPGAPVVPSNPVVTPSPAPETSPHDRLITLTMPHIVSPPAQIVGGPEVIVDGPSRFVDAPTGTVGGPTGLGAGPTYIQEESALIGENPKYVAKPSRSTVPIIPDEHYVPPENVRPQLVGELGSVNGGVAM